MTFHCAHCLTKLPPSRRHGDWCCTKCKRYILTDVDKITEEQAAEERAKRKAEVLP